MKNRRIRGAGRKSPLFSDHYRIIRTLDAARFHRSASRSSMRALSQSASFGWPVSAASALALSRLVAPWATSAAALSSSPFTAASRSAASGDVSTTDSVHNSPLEFSKYAISVADMRKTRRANGVARRSRGTGSVLP
eukprot:5356104-Prymnesium_polylepis.2